MDEAFNKVFAEPIRPHFAIVAIGQSFEMDVALRLVCISINVFLYWLYDGLFDCTESCTMTCRLLRN